MLFKKTNRLNPKLLGDSHDPKDPKLGEIIKYHPPDHDSGHIVELGCLRNGCRAVFREGGGCK